MEELGLGDPYSAVAEVLPLFSLHIILKSYGNEGHSLEKDTWNWQLFSSVAGLKKFYSLVL